MNEKSILKKAILIFGDEKQTDMMIEEMSELTKALLKYRRYGSKRDFENIIEEMADVSIVLEQMQMIYGDFADKRKEKIKRLSKRMEALNDE